jgi:hypothetical protein
MAVNVKRRDVVDGSDGEVNGGEIGRRGYWRIVWEQRNGNNTGFRLQGLQRELRNGSGSLWCDWSNATGESFNVATQLL